MLYEFTCFTSSTCFFFYRIVTSSFSTQFLLKQEQDRVGEDSLRHTACQPPTATVTHINRNTHTGPGPAPAICVCLYVGLLYQEMCYINVWKRMNGCWNESFDIWKVQKVSLLRCQGQRCFFEESFLSSLDSQPNLDLKSLKEKRLFFFLDLFTERCGCRWIWFNWNIKDRKQLFISAIPDG